MPLHRRSPRGRGLEQLGSWSCRDLWGVGLFNVPDTQRPPALRSVAVERVRTTRPRRFELSITFDAQPIAPVGHDDRHRPLLSEPLRVHGRPGTRNPLRPGPGCGPPCDARPGASRSRSSILPDPWHRERRPAGPHHLHVQVQCHERASTSRLGDPLDRLTTVMLERGIGDRLRPNPKQRVDLRVTASAQRPGH
jgi:hypothetical protein